MSDLKYRCHPGTVTWVLEVITNYFSNSMIKLKTHFSLLYFLHKETKICTSSKRTSALFK